jgi:hypothetical protein
MRSARLLLLVTLISPGAAFAQSQGSNKAPQHHEKPSTAKPDPKGSKDADKAAKKTDKDAAKTAAKKSENAQNTVYSQAYKTSVPKP